MSQQDAFEYCLTKLYESTLDVRGWTNFLVDLDRFIPSFGGQFHLWDPRANRMVYAAMPDWFSADGQREYNEQYAATDPRRKLSERTPPGNWVFDHDHFDDAFVRRSPVYQEVLLPYDIRYGAGLTLVVENGLIAALGVLRRPDQEVFLAHERAALARLTPHLLRAASIGVKLEGLRQACTAGTAGLDSFEEALFVVDPRARIVYRNHAGELALQDGEILGAQSEFLVAADYRVSERLRYAIQVAVDRGRAGSLVVRDVLSNEFRARIVVTPLAPSNPMAQGMSGPKVLVVISRSHVHGSSTQLILMEGLGLTAGEARIAQGIGEGVSLEELAARYGVSIHTARSQLKAAMHKLDVRRQSALVGLVRRLPRLRSR